MLADTLPKPGTASWAGTVASVACARAIDVSATALLVSLLSRCSATRTLAPEPCCENRLISLTCTLSACCG